MSGNFGHASCECPRCGKHYGFWGPITEHPGCPACGWRPSQESLEKFDKQLDEARERARLKSEAEWAARTPVQQAAYDEGRAAFDPNVSMIDRLKLNPYTPRKLNGAPDPENRARCDWNVLDAIGLARWGATKGFKP